MKEHLKDLPIMAFGSLRMDKGEGLEYAFASIKRMSAKYPQYYAYDIICTTEQLREANRVLPIIRKEIRKHNPKLKEKNFSMGITTNFYERPGAEPLMRRLVKKGVNLDASSVVDLNPNREKNWAD